MDVYKKFVKYSGCFFERSVNEENFSNTVFSVLEKILPLKTGYIFFINQNDLSLKYKTQNVILAGNITDEEFSEKFNNSYHLISELHLDNYPYAKLVVGNDKAYSAQDKEVFSSVSRIISGLVKDTEISSVLKMQVELLQNGMYELSKANKTIRMQNKKIAASEKVKSEFFANASHQLRSPLNSIIGYADLLNTELPGKLSKKQKVYINDIKVAGINLLEMVNEVLDMSKLESGAMELFKTTFNLKNNFVEVLNILYPLYNDKNITIEVNIEEDEKITADYQKLQQVFFNIISNAIKFTPENGIIQISAKFSGENTNISIKDNGIGIAKENHKKIFKKFAQVNPSQTSSTGLGLTIAKEIVKLHSGKISIVSDVGKGCEFIIKLPKC